MYRVSREATLLNMVVTAAPETETELEAEGSANTRSHKICTRDDLPWCFFITVKAAALVVMCPRTMEHC